MYFWIPGAPYGYGARCTVRIQPFTSAGERKQAPPTVCFHDLGTDLNKTASFRKAEICSTVPSTRHSRYLLNEETVKCIFQWDFPFGQLDLQRALLL